MKKIFSIMILIGLCCVISCSRDSKPAAENEVQVQEEVQPALDERVAMYRASVYKDMEHADWLATLNKAEQVVLIEELEAAVTIKGKEEKLAKVRLSDDSEGYIRVRYLAEKAVVIIDDEVAAYNRNNRTSGQHSLLPKGTVCFVVDQKANWLKITVGKLPDGTKVYNRWIDGGFSEDQGLISDAVLIEGAMQIISGEKDGDVNAAYTIIEEVANKGNEMSQVAMLRVEEGDEGHVYEYPEDAILASVTASNLKIRKDPDTEGEELAMAPRNSTVQILEEKDDEVEIGGTTGRWMRINFEGTEGWAFGAFLEKM